MEKHLAEEMPFIATENILMDAVSRGGDRQELHEVIRRYSQEAAIRVKAEGMENCVLVLAGGSDAYMKRGNKVYPSDTDGERVQKFLKKIGK